MSENFKFQAPYRFVPYSKQVLVPSWGSKVSHDLPFADGEDGTIVLRWKNLTPICVSKDKEPNGWCYPCSVIDSEGKRHYYLPGTSIKGMIQSVMENMCMAWFDRYNDDFMGFRDISNGDYRARMEDQHCGWLEKIGETHCQIVEVSDNADSTKVSYDKLRPWKNISDCKKLLLSDKSFLSKGFDERYPLLPDGSARLVCTGDIFGKKHQYLFGPDTNVRYRVDDDVLKDFCSSYKPSPYYDGLMASLKEGKRVAVFYKVDGRRVNSIGLTKMFRLACKNRVSSGISQIAYDENGSKVQNGKDLVQVIFGSIDSHYGESLKGRVQFGHAMSIPCDDVQLDVVEGVFGGPAASFYPLYLEQTKGSKWVTYDKAEGITLSGRKRYPIHDTTEIPKGNDNEKMLTRVHMLPVGQEFSMKIHVHNLRPIEIGALLSAITFHQVPGCFHNLGLGKPFGYGRLNLEEIELKGFISSEADYLKQFEGFMQVYCKKVCGTEWVTSPQMKSLLNYASYHKDVNFLHVMALKDYTATKHLPKAIVLQETDIPYFKDRIVDERLMAEKLEFERINQNVIALLSSKSFSKADAMISTSKLLHHDAELAELKSLIERKRDEYLEHHLSKTSPEEDELRHSKIVTKGLGVLEEQIDGSYKVKQFKVGKEKVEKWLKETGTISVPENECSILKTYLSRQYESDMKGSDKKIRAKWSYDDAYSNWRTVEKWVGAETAKSWAEEFMDKKS